jgi:hypothetical protein
MGEAGFIPRLTRDQEMALSVQMQQGREKVMRGVATFGVAALKILQEKVSVEEGIFDALYALQKANKADEIVRMLTEMSIEDDHSQR